MPRGESLARRFPREARTASAVRGPGVAPLPGYDLDGPVPWTAAAHPAGPSPAETVTEHGPFAGAGARALSAEPARAVAVVHEAGPVHRDLKPSTNIALTSPGARIVDFGIARPEYGLTLTQPGWPRRPGVTRRRNRSPAPVRADPAAVGYRVVQEDAGTDDVRLLTDGRTRYVLRGNRVRAAP
ncbi:hypothetical protein AB0D34_19705 [Streptomyces sp. NPDC048420]|uniref:hypothetical protein n=1 Tax=Streptomyces sp. NPDC048420 TaxID=3155755 RepID=UPI00342F5C49